MKLEEVNNYSTRHYETASGLETWFTPPDRKNGVARRHLDGK
jgi:hypothetical protein